jgi:uncharacterized protein YcaQ
MPVTSPSALRMTAAAARTMMVAALGLDRPLRRRATKADVLAAIRMMNVLQIDTIHVVARSPYLVLWSRLGDYQPVWLEELLAEGRLYEYWAHEACFLPVEDYPLYRHRMLDPDSMGWKYSHEWKQAHHDVVEHVRSELQRRGPLRSADFERRDGRKGGGWWSWKPEKRALETLFTLGEIMVARRDRFQRVYDLRERVLPAWDDVRLPPAEETERTLIGMAAVALGVATPRWLADYFRMPRRRAAAAVKALIAAGTLQEVRVDGWTEPAYIHTDSRARFEAASEGSLATTLTTVLSPFDPLVWERARARTVFDFDYALECYTPAPKRRYGYFVLPVLRRGRLVGRLDAKAHRSTGSFEVKGFWTEAGVRPSAAFWRDVGSAIARLAAWHDTPEVIIRQATPRAHLRELRRTVEQGAA